MLLKEPNFKRRAQRIALPVWIEIDGKRYSVRDLSVVGIGVEGTGWDIGDQLEAVLVLPFKEASVAIPVKLVCRRVEGNVSGFEFVDLTPQKKRAIRQYIEFAIEGRLDDVETVMATLNLPTVDSPITESLALAQEEEAQLYRSFRRHMLFWLLFGTLVLMVVAGFIVYNSLFVFKTYGVVAGSEVNVSSRVSGVISRIHAKTGDYVHKGKVLFELENPSLLSQLEIVRAQIELIKKELASEETPPTTSPVLQVLKELYDAQLKEYRRAKNLYEKRLISIKDLKFVENNLLRIKLKLAQAQEKSTHKPKPKIDLQMELKRLEAKKRELEEKIKELRVTAPVSGWIKEVKLNEGTAVHERDVVMVMEKEPLFVLCTIPNWEITRLAVDEPVKIYSPLTGKTYNGRISVVGFPTTDFGSEATLVKVDFAKDPGLPVNSKVVVWLRNEIYARFKRVLQKIRI